MGSKTTDQTYRLSGNNNNGKGSFNEKIKAISPTVTFQYQAVTSLSICSVTDFTKCTDQSCSIGGVNNSASVCNYLYTLKLVLLICKLTIYLIIKSTRHLMIARLYQVPIVPITHR